MRLIIPTIAIILLVMWAQDTVRGQEDVYGRLEQAWAGYLDPDDDLGWPMKVHSLQASPYKFWRGTKDLYYQWAHEVCADWLANPDSYGITHGDLHLGNIGTYAAGDRLGEMAFGMVDFDDSAVLPVQLELLQGMITLRLVASANDLPMDERSAAAVCAALLDAYAQAYASGKSATQLLEDDPQVARLLARTSRPYERVLRDDVSGDRIVRQVAGDRGKIKEIFRPAGDKADAIAAALADAIAADASLAEKFRLHDRESLRAAILDIAWRTRVGSSGSQGLGKLFVLMDSPLKDRSGPTLIYLKQTIPSAAERAGVIPRSSYLPSARLLAHARALQSPDAFLGGWCMVEDASYWISLREPWSDELDADDVRTFDDLLAAARIWGTVAGSAHAAAGCPDVSRDSRLGEQLVGRSRAYMAFNRAAFDAFSADPQARQAAAAAAQHMAELNNTYRVDP